MTASFAWDAALVQCALKTAEVANVRQPWQSVQEIPPKHDWKAPKDLVAHESLAACSQGKKKRYTHILETGFSLADAVQVDKPCECDLARMGRDEGRLEQASGSRLPRSRSVRGGGQDLAGTIDLVRDPH